MKKIGTILTAVLLTVTLTACNSSKNTNESTTATSSQTAKTRTIKDMAKTKVTLPTKVNKVINLWPANTQVQMLLSGTDQLAGTTAVNKQLPWATLVFPDLKKVPDFTQASGGDINTEEMLNKKPDVVMSSDENQIKTIRDAGMNGVYVNFRDFDGLKATVRKTGEVLGGDAPAKADQFVKYFDEKLADVADRTKDVKNKPKVYEIQGDTPLGTDGKDSIATQWIEAAGGINAMAEVTDENMTNVTMEEILNAKPDVFILGTQNAAKIKKQIMNDEDWKSIPAVANDQVYANPIDTFLWSRYSCEEALQVLWTAKILHPDEFKDLDMQKEVQDFYKEFYNFDLTDAQAKKMLAGQNP